MMVIEDLYIKSLGAYLPDRQAMSAIETALTASASASGSASAEAGSSLDNPYPGSEEDGLDLSMRRDRGAAAGEGAPDGLQTGSEYAMQAQSLYETICVADDVAPADMAVLAAREALKGHGTQVDLLVHSQLFQQGPEGWAPAGYILRELGLTNATGYEVIQGANGFLASLQVAAGLLALGPASSNALLTSSINAGSAFLDRRYSGGSGTVLGDGGAAAVLGRDSGIARVDSIISITLSELEGMHRGLVPIFEKDERIRPLVCLPDRGREFAFESAFGPMEVFGKVARAKREAVKMAFSDAGIESRDLAKVIHPHINPDVFEESILKPLGLTLEKSTWDFGRTVGHVGAADYILSLDHLVKTGQLSDGDRVLLIGGAAGYNVSSAVLTISGSN